MRSTSDGHSAMDDAKPKKLFKALTLGLSAVVIFLAGMGAGNGAITFGTNANQANKNLASDLNYAAVEDIYDLLKANYDGKLDQQKLLDGLKGGLADATGDPYTQYFNRTESKAFEDELNGSFSGIGAELGENEDGNIVIISPIEGFPASKAGLRPQDILASIDGATTIDMSINEAVSKIRGEKGSNVTLRIIRGKSQELSFTITREDIKIPSVKWQNLDGNIGYIQINQFGNDTVDLMRQAASSIKDEGAKRIILDLRGNPGGILPASVDIASMWLPEGKTILEEKRGGVLVKKYISETDGEPVFKDIPTIVLLNAGSASASEIVAGALRDNNAAQIYGEKSYGKGSVQELYPLPTGDEIKITVARWYRPNGQNIDKKGITPDKAIKLSEDDYKQKKDPQKDAAIEYLRTK